MVFISHPSFSIISLRRGKKKEKKDSFPENSFSPGTHIPVNILNSIEIKLSSLTLLPMPYNQKTVPVQIFLLLYPHWTVKHIPKGVVKEKT